MKYRDISGGPVVKNLPSNAGDVSSIPGQGTKIICAAGQLRPRVTIIEPEHPSVRAPQEKPVCHKWRSPCVLQLDACLPQQGTQVPQQRPSPAKKKPSERQKWSAKNTFWQISSRYEGKVKSFPHKQKLREVTPLNLPRNVERSYSSWNKKYTELWLRW